MDQELHPFLKRQIRRFLHEEDIDGTELEKFILAVDSSYKHFSRERELMETSSNRMMEEMKHKNESLKRLISSLDDFNYHVSHDLKSGVINNLSLSKMLKKYLENGEEKMVEEITEKLQENSERNLNTIRQFLRIAKEDINISNTEDVQLINFKEQVNEVLLEFDPADFEIDIAVVGLESFVYSLVQFKSVLRNLISNSIRYRKESSRAKIAVCFYHQELNKRIVYRDNGIGIDLKKRKDKIFKAFEADQRYSNSSGVGLYLTKKIIESNGGTITLESKLGEGVCFKIML